MFRRSGSEIEAHEGQRSDRLAPLHVLVGPKLIRINGVPGFIEHPRPILLRPHTIEPVVARNKVAARISNDGDTQSAHLLHHVLAEAIRISQLRCRIVDTLINRASQLLEE